ncbi:TonB-dependent receptor [Vibrio tapetis subsp. quintayensis]|uniref:TonB-dependent receptor n=1 Tax=Vibrio tapetis TaxID=52443 RepID=UPI0025B38858|nr:TonB-dependent receptor [Vibrio tapetis]MDN3680880.1 TonB-dependent receptor [Vibrio tapetis subsp. quintayensis]
MKLLRMERLTKSQPNRHHLSALAASIAVACFGIQTNLAVAAEETKDGTVPTLVVYGDKSERSLQETSASVVVYDQDSMQEKGINSTQDLLRMSPNIVDTGYGNQVATIRGVDGSGPGVGAAAFISGAKPRLNVSLDGRTLSYNELAYGTSSMWDMQQAEVYLGPQSYIQGRNSIAGTVVLVSNDPVFERQFSAKGGLGNHGYQQTALVYNDVLVDDQVALRISADRQYKESAVALVSYDPAGNSKEIESNVIRAKLLVEPSKIPELSSTLTISRNNIRSPQGEYEPDDSPNAAFPSTRPVFEGKSNSYVWDLNYDATSNIELTFNTNYTDFEIERIVPKGERFAADIQGKEYHIEPSLRYRTDSEQLDLLVGARYFSNSQDDSINGMGSYEDQTKTQSVYLQAIYNLSSKLVLTAVGRYESEKRFRQGGTGPFALELDKTYNNFLPKLALAWSSDENNTFGVSAAKGFSSGGAGVSFTTRPPTVYTFDEESVWNYEFFTRHRLMNQRMQLTTNVFYNDYKDLQQLTGSTISNIESAKSYGAEATMDWFATEDLSIFANMGLLKTKINDTTQHIYDGKEFARAPAFTGATGLNYWLGNFEFNGNVQYVGDYYSTTDNIEEGKIPAYTTVNASIGYVFDYGRATLFANNLLDSNKVILYEARGTVYSESPLLQRDRTVGLSVQLDF